MSFQCKKCGSVNHRSDDCSKPYSGWKELGSVLTLQNAPSALLPVQERKSSPNQALAAAASVKTQYLDPITGRNEHGRSGPLPKRANFPFLRESTKRQIEERTARMMAGGHRQLQPKMTTNEKRETLVVPKKTKQLQGGLF